MNMNIHEPSVYSNVVTVALHFHVPTLVKMLLFATKTRHNPSTTPIKYIISQLLIVISLPKIIVFFFTYTLAERTDR